MHDAVRGRRHVAVREARHDVGVVAAMPRVVHAEGIQDVRGEEIAVRLSADLLDDVSEHVVVRVAVGVLRARRGARRHLL